MIKAGDLVRIKDHPNPEHIHINKRIYDTIVGQICKVVNVKEERFALNANPSQAIVYFTNIVNDGATKFKFLDDGIRGFYFTEDYLEVVFTT